MKPRITAEQLKAFPLNFTLSFQQAAERGDNSGNADENILHHEALYPSAFHQNNNKKVFEGFYKSITRKIS
jgi:hypothetical protein